MRYRRGERLQVSDTGIKEPDAYRNPCSVVQEEVSPVIRSSYTAKRDAF